MLSLAREFAMDIFDIETILNNHKITQKEWQRIEKNPRFQALLDEAIRAWNSATNTSERVKLKFMSTLELAIPEMWERLVDPKFGDNAKVELFKALQRGAGVGAAGVDAQLAGERFKLVINIGNGSESRIEAKLPTQVIEGEVVGAE